MDLQTKVKLKNSQLLVHRNMLLMHLDHHVVENGSEKLLPTFIIASFVAGFISYRVRSIFIGIQKLKIFRYVFPFGGF